MGKHGYCALHKPYEGQKDFDKYYIDIELKQKFVADDDQGNGHIETVAIEHKRDIEKTIEAQNGYAGIDAFLAPYIQAGVPLPGVEVTDEIVDVSKAPEDLAEAIKLGDNALKAFKSLDPALTKGKSFEDFISTCSQADLDAYYASLIKSKTPKAPAPVKKEAVIEKKEGDK